ncbi:transposase [Flavobacterium sp. MXW15]|uniref:Transposase n=1 Tax=Xanthomonas chitinilytica TaxID=2989819 RepID=A0ABT3JZA5_9XANT|nr:transposase [Xanthomonas sp. H13-6]MCW4453997.1 transposase [Flavobacterium sp. MXW15]MCW4473835.1 transposase [Xanthomonas sp. H13-6]
MSSPRLLHGRNSRIGALYAVTTVVLNRQSMFTQHGCACAVAGELARIETEGRARNLAWVVMPDHVHWLFELRTDDLSRCVQAFKSRSARAVNLVRGTSGTVWQAGFYDHCLRGDEDLIGQARYIVCNPLRSGLVDALADHPYWYCPWISTEADL